MVENFGFDACEAAYARMLSGKQRFIVNLVTPFGQAQGIKVKA